MQLSRQTTLVFNAARYKERRTMTAYPYAHLLRLLLVVMVLPLVGCSDIPVAPPHEVSTPSIQITVEALVLLTVEPSSEAPTVTLNLSIAPTLVPVQIGVPTIVPPPNNAGGSNGSSQLKLLDQPVNLPKQLAYTPGA